MSVSLPTMDCGHSGPHLQTWTAATWGRIFFFPLWSAVTWHRIFPSAAAQPPRSCFKWTAVTWHRDFFSAAAQPPRSGRPRSPGAGGICGPGRPKTVG